MTAPPRLARGKFGWFICRRKPVRTCCFAPLYMGMDYVGNLGYTSGHGSYFQAGVKVMGYTKKKDKKSENAYGDRH